MYSVNAISSALANSQMSKNTPDTKTVVSNFWNEMKSYVGWLADPSEESFTLSGLGVELAEEDIGSTFHTLAAGQWTQLMSDVIESLAGTESFKTDIYKQLGQMMTS